MDLMELVVKIKADSEGLTKKLDEVQSSVSSFGSKVGGILSGAGKVAMAGVGMAVAGVTALTKQSVAAYGEFQQLEGGVETLFGTGGKDIKQYAASVGKSVFEVGQEFRDLERAESIVMENAKKAFNESGLSMNQYMEQATQMAASLKQSLGGDTIQAAKYADIAIKDMSDNANKMGTNIQSIQNAYQGFAKQNYTMLDNLKLGYGGTKSEMERLIRDAEKMNSTFKVQHNTLKNGNDEIVYSYADIVEAIHIVQEETGILGTTQAEAGHTITGSLASVKAAWDNVLTTIASGDDKELNTQIDNFMQSAGKAAENLVPTIVNALKGIGKMVKELAPVLAKELPGLLKEIIPDLVSAATVMLKTAIPIIGEVLPGLIRDIAPLVVDGFIELFKVVVEEFPTIIESLIEAFEGIGETLLNALEEYFPGISDTMDGMMQLFKDLEPVVWAVVGAFVAYKAALLISEIISAVQGVITTLTIATEGQTLAQTLLNVATMSFPGTWIIAIIGAVIGVIGYLLVTSEDFRDGFIRVCQLVGEAISGLWEAFWAAIDGIILMFQSLWETCVNFFENGISAWAELFQNFKDALHEAWESWCDFVEQKIEALVGWFEDLVAKWEEIADRFEKGFTGPAATMEAKMNELNNTAETQLGGLSSQSYSWGYDLSSNMASGIESGAGKVRASIQGLAQYVQNNWGHSHPTEGPMKDDDKWMPDFMDNLVNGIDNNRYRVEDAIDRTASSLAEIGSDMDVPDFNTNVTANGGDIVIPLYLDGSIIDERIVTAQQIHDYRSGGR